MRKNELAASADAADERLKELQQLIEQAQVWIDGIELRIAIARVSVAEWSALMPTYMSECGWVECTNAHIHEWVWLSGVH